MPANKNALLRYKVLDDCFKRRGRYWPVEVLMEKVGEALREDGGPASVSKRTIQEDIKNLRLNYQAPIETESGRGYYYTDPGFSISNTPLTLDDLPVLHQSLAVLRQLQALGVSDELDEVVQRIEQRLTQPGAAPAPDVVHFEQVPAYTGLTWLRPLYQAIRQREVLWLTYQPFQASSARRELVHPHLLKEFNHRWFLLGLNAQNVHVTSTYALDRIVAIEPANAPYRPGELDPKAYFQHVIGASVPPNGEVVEIHLRFSPARSPYVLTKPLHPTQLLVAETSQSTEFTLQLIPTREFITLLLSFGADVEVLAPASLREYLRQQLDKACANYSVG
ncbi:helix-turn-helix transcriptional regulator [Hymenobacter elongatus]|uniref:WYL domain-containing transcriptional regulator n=1 Tax=Hymenobacter elongatus TaxID=877208 RepID=A0A4Z0PJW5_9BACT|nr:WYL domain-containing transcriptional regulator [Hymenobacter elongatus]TGE15972.1 WYL domain-containing transcriptional regulator [Hymenobacter elongatus]